MKILLFHMRKDPQICRPEYENFMEHCGLPPDQLTGINLHEQPILNPTILDDYDAFLVGGYSDDPDNRLDLDLISYPFINTFDTLLQHAIKTKKPGLLSCGGFMMASSLLGGTLTLDPTLSEMDILNIQLSDNALDDPLLVGFPKTMAIVSGHLKSTLTLPPNTTLLASSEHCPIHAFKVNETPLYAFQGHPEITADQLKERVGPYRHKYFDSEDEFKKFISTTTATPYANGILAAFVAMVQAR